MNHELNELIGNAHSKIHKKQEDSLVRTCDVDG